MRDPDAGVVKAPPVEVPKNQWGDISLAMMAKDPKDFRVRMVDAFVEGDPVEFLVTPSAANCNRLMREKGIPVVCVDELAQILACSHSLAMQGEGGLNIEALRRYLEHRYAGREIGLSLAGFRMGPMYEKEKPCTSSSTSSDAASPDEPLASTSMETSTKTSAEDANATPESST